MKRKSLDSLASGSIAHSMCSRTVLVSVTHPMRTLKLRDTEPIAHSSSCFNSISHLAASSDLSSTEGCFISGVFARGDHNSICTYKSNDYHRRGSEADRQDMVVLVDKHGTECW